MINQDQLNHLSKELLAAKQKAHEGYLHKILQNEGKCWAEFYRYARRRKSNKVNIPGLKGINGGIITDPLEKANILNSYCVSVFSRKNDHQQRTAMNSECREVLSVCSKTLRNRLASSGKKNISRT